MPVGKRHAIHQAMKDSGLEFIDHPPPDLSIITEFGMLRIGNVEAQIGNPKHPELVPEVLFYGMVTILALLLLTSRRYSQTQVSVATNAQRLFAWRAFTASWKSRCW